MCLHTRIWQVYIHQSVWYRLHIPFTTAYNNKPTIGGLRHSEEHLIIPSNAFALTSRCHIVIIATHSIVDLIILNSLSLDELSIILEEKCCDIFPLLILQYSDQTAA